MILLTRRHILGSIAALAGTVALPGSGRSAEFINIATGGTSGVYYPLGVALSKVYGSVLPGAKISVQATKASVENLNLVQAGRAEVAFSLADAVADAWNGEKEAGFNTKLTKLRAIGGLYNNYVQIVASEASGIKTLADLKGKRISVGAPRSGTELNARAVLGAAGITYKDFSKVEYLPFGESVDLMKNRQLDVTLQSAGLGVSSIKDLATSLPIVVVPVPEDIVRKIGNPAYQASVIPAGTYEGQKADAPAVAITNILVTREDLPDETAYQLTKSMFEHLSDLAAAHSAAKAIDVKKAAQSLPIPLHPGAERYYKEVGAL
ncbi:TAXI family TRAP transporter solute-binding subunit [Rhodoligotrophos ferricapiens]|uniref:TAXI family TRAP transporter solute-binding subunit n=1 Tax=Rhodoligotrophos ferricapiens TaxID=3069264 RepID=UPI00315C8FF8